MGFYHVRPKPKGVAVRHIAVFPFFMGCIAVLGGATGLYFSATDLQSSSGMDFWVPFLVCLGALAIGLYLILLQPASKQVLFVVNSKELEIMDWSLVNSSMRTLVHKGLDTFSVLETDSDGYWYTPTIELADGGKFEIGFGCHDVASAQSVIDRIIKLDNFVRRRYGS